MALAQFFFPSSRSKKAKRSSRAHLPTVNISKNHGANIYPCVWMTPPNASHAHHRHACKANGTGAMCSETENWAPWRRSESPGWSDSTAGKAKEDIPFTPLRPARRPNSGHRQRQQNPAHERHDGGLDIPRFSLYSNAISQAQTCFVGKNPDNSAPAAAPPRDFHDQTIRFRVIDQTQYRDDDGAAAQGQGEMVVVSSPANIPWVVETLAPRGSGRRAVIQARTPRGSFQQGGLEYLARILPQGYPFVILLEDE
jgi:hypothetical protein